ncbi:AhpC/TSA family protein [bacterium]|nr:AhpC/TSA family protein [bacterium]
MCGRQQEFREAGADLAVVGSGSPEDAAWFAGELGVPVRVLTDPDLATFRAVGARYGIASSLHPGTFRAAWKLYRRGFRQSETRGAVQQQGAVWIVRPGGVSVYRYASRFAGDHPDPAEVVTALASAQR